MSDPIPWTMNPLITPSTGQRHSGSSHEDDNMGLPSSSLSSTSAWFTPPYAGGLPKANNSQFERIPRWSNHTWCSRGPCLASAIMSPPTNCRATDFVFLTYSTAPVATQDWAQTASVAKSVQPGPANSAAALKIVSSRESHRLSPQIFVYVGEQFAFEH